MNNNDNHNKPSVKDEVLRKLSSGLYHNIFSQISVILGQAEIIDSENRVIDESPISMKVDNSIEKLKKAADYITGYMRILEELNFRSISSDNISINSFLSDLNALTQGYDQGSDISSEIKIRFSVETNSSIDFNISYKDIFEIILPIVLGIYDKAQKTGTVELISKSSLNYDHLIFKIEKTIIDSFVLIDIINSIFPDCEPYSEEKNRHRIELDNLSVSYGHDNEICFIDISKPTSLFKHESASEKETIVRGK